MKDSLILALLILAALLGLAAGAQYLQVKALKTTLAEERLAYAQQSADAAIALAYAERRYREAEQALVDATERHRHERAQTKLAHDRVVADLRLSNQRLRADLAAYAADQGAGPDQDSLAACQARASALGDLLHEGVRLQLDLAAAAEAHNADARSLYDWAEHVRLGVSNAAEPQPADRQADARPGAAPADPR